MSLLQVTTKKVNPRRTNLFIKSDHSSFIDYIMTDLGFCYQFDRNPEKHGYELSQLLMTRLNRSWKDPRLQLKIETIKSSVPWDDGAKELYSYSVRLIESVRAIKHNDSVIINQIISDFGLDPESFSLPLKDHQLQALALYILLGYANNWGQMRTGKTPPSIIYTYSLFIKQEIDTILVVCPNSIKQIWLDEIGRFTSPLVQKLSAVVKGTKSYKEGIWKGSHLFKVANYEAVRADAETVLDAYGDRRYCLVLDESHRVKNPSKQTQVIQSLVYGDNPPVSLLALSGTPVANKPHDVQRVVGMTAPCLLGSSFDDFKRKYCYIGGYTGRDVTGYKKDALKTIHNFMARCSVRVLRSEVDMDLGKDVQAQTVPMSKVQTKVHKEINEILRTELYGESGEWSQVRVHGFLAKAMKLQQVTAGFIFDNAGNPVWLGDKNNPKLQWLDSFIKEYLDDIEKLVIACRFRPVVEKLTRRYTMHGATCIYGGVKPQDRAVRMKLFKESPECKVMVVNIATTEGLDLNPCQFMAFVTRDFYPLPNWQTEDRITGFNQQGEATIIPLVCEGSIDKNVDKVLSQKQKWFDAVVDGKGADAGGLNLTKEDLFTLIE